jgi:hypothetical protein
MSVNRPVAVGMVSVHRDVIDMDGKVARIEIETATYREEVVKEFVLLADRSLASVRRPYVCCCVLSSWLGRDGRPSFDLHQRLRSSEEFVPIVVLLADTIIRCTEIPVSPACVHFCTIEAARWNAARSTTRLFEPEEI